MKLFLVFLAAQTTAFRTKPQRRRGELNIKIGEDSMLSLLDELGISVKGETSTHFIAYCPFHNNTDTPAFNIDKRLGVWRCWNPDCGSSGTLVALIMRIVGGSEAKARRMIVRHARGKVRSARRIESEPDDLSTDSIDEESLLKNLRRDISNLTYLVERGFTEKTIRDFEAGWDGEAICMPVRDEQGRLLGLTRRIVSGNGPKYKDNDLPKSRTLFNIDKVIDSREVVVVEGPFDAMKVHQAGFPVVATMMGGLSERQKRLLLKHFDTIVIFTDNDEAGRRLGKLVEDSCAGKRIYWVPYLYPVKDPGEMDDEQIRDCISKKIPAFLLRMGRYGKMGTNPERSDIGYVEGHIDRAKGSEEAS
jgi:DNA primase